MTIAIGTITEAREKKVEEEGAAMAWSGRKIDRQMSDMRFRRPAMVLIDLV